MMVAPFLPASGWFMWIGFVLAERIMFLPTIGFCVLLVLLLRPALRRQAGGITHSLAWALLLLTVMLGSWRSVQRNPEWNTLDSLYTAVLRDYPMNAKASHNLAHDMMGNSAKVSEAVSHFRSAIKHYPMYGTAYINLGVTYAKNNRVAEACALWKGAVDTYDSWTSKIMGEHPTLVRNYHRCVRQIGDSQEVSRLESKYRNLLQE